MDGSLSLAQPQGLCLLAESSRGATSHCAQDRSCVRIDHVSAAPNFLNAMSSLPLPVDRNEIHHRTISIRGYRRGDGLWDIEGHLMDVRSERAIFAGGAREANEPIHSMWLRLTIENNARISAAVAATEASPYPGVCGRIAPDYGALVGLTIGPGFRGHVRRLFGAQKGCTHMSELLSAMATGALQTLAGERGAIDEERKPFQLDGCHALATDGPIVQAFYPRWFRRLPA